MRKTPTTDKPRAGPLPVYLLAADEEPVVVEGRWQRDKVVLVCFPDRDRFERWASSPAYQRISTDRTASTEGTVLLVRGLVGGKSGRRQ